MKETEEEAYFHKPDVKPSVRPAQIAKADCILSHPGGLLGKVFNQVMLTHRKNLIGYNIASVKECW